MLPCPGVACDSLLTFVSQSHGSVPTHHPGLDDKLVGPPPPGELKLRTLDGSQDGVRLRTRGGRERADKLHRSNKRASELAATTTPDVANTASSATHPRLPEARAASVREEAKRPRIRSCWCAVRASPEHVLAETRRKIISVTRSKRVSSGSSGLEARSRARLERFFVAPASTRRMGGDRCSTRHRRCSP